MALDASHDLEIPADTLVHVLQDIAATYDVP
jgi:hypothetical protein